MPGKPKSGPPYTDLPNEVYVVVTNPWGMNSDPRKRTRGDFDRVASWAQFALQKSGLGGGIPTVECIYGMGTRNEIILQFAEGTDIIPLLGQHRWSSFWKHCPGSDDPRSTQSTCVFIYNWRNNGDPSNHNWTENFPRTLSFGDAPFKSSYPAPSWASPPLSLTNLVHALPRPPTPPPMPDERRNASPGQQSATPPPPLQGDHPESGEQPAEASTSLFRPYEPPSQYPPHARLLDRSQSRGASEGEGLPPFPKLIKKLDPYELEEDALNALRSPTPEPEGAKEVKEEDTEPTPLRSVKSEYPHVKEEEEDARRDVAPETSSGYQPSQALIDAFSSLRQPLPARSPTRGLGELGGDVDTPAPSGSVTRPVPNAHVVVKREYEDDVVTCLGGRKKIKIENN